MRKIAIAYSLPASAAARFHQLSVLLLLALCGCGGTGSGVQMVPQGAPTATEAVGSPASSASAPSPAPTASASLKAQVEELERQGRLLKLDRSSSIVGPDVNNNGVRDDIEAYLQSLPLTPAQLKAVMQDARATQMTLTVDLRDKVALQRVGDALMASTNCLSNILESQTQTYLSMRIEAMTANTRERTARYLEYNAARSGSITSLPDGDTCEK